MHIPLVGIIENGFLTITSDPILATHKFEISNDVGDAQIRLVGCISGQQQTVDLKISSVATELGITPKEVVEQNQAGTLFVSRDGLEGEEIDLEPEEEAFLITEAESLRKKAAETGVNIDLSKGKGEAPASMHITPEGFIFVHEKSYDRGSKGAFKHCKTAVMISPEGERREVARMVIHLSKQRDRGRVIGSTVAEAKVMSEVQGGGHLGHLYGLIARTNKRGEQILTLYLEYFPDGNLREAKKTMTDKEKIVAAGGIIESYYVLWLHGFAHNDLKLENMLWSGEKAVVADFGNVSRLGSRDAGPLGGTTAFFSPQKKMAYKAYKSRLPRTWTQEDNFRGDVWALGLSLYELFIDDLKPLKNVEIADYRDTECSLMESAIPGISTGDPDNLIHLLIRDMLYCLSEDRPTIEEVYGRWKEIEQALARGDSPSGATTSSTCSPLFEQDNATSEPTTYSTRQESGAAKEPAEASEKLTDPKWVAQFDSDP
jgi:serine/threonine protein kinase